MEISAIVAVDEKYGIGKNNKLPFFVREDMAHFKRMTTGNIVVCGSRTFQSMGSTPLPNRINVVISSKPTDKKQEVIYTKIEDALDALKSLNEKYPEKKIFIIGGSQVYSYFAEHTKYLYLTKIPGNYNCDTFFDISKFDGFKVVSSDKLQNKETGKLICEFVVKRGVPL